MSVAARPGFSFATSSATTRRQDLLDFHAGLVRLDYRALEPAPGRLDYKVVRLEAATSGLLYKARLHPRPPTCALQRGPHITEIADAPEVRIKRRK
jgi:hypothetical protein